jgi:hypothetical protein
MVDPTIASLFRDAAKLLRARFEVIRSTNPHAGEKGAEVEEILKQFLNEHLPQRFRAGSGIVLDTDNALSRQQDVIVYDALSSPLYRYAPKTQIVPMDAVVSVIEVKSNLTGAELADGYAKVASCKRLKKRPMQAEELRTNRSGAFHGTTGIVFAFGSTLALETIIEHAKELNDEYDSELWPEIIVVLDAGLITYAIQYPGAPKFAGSLMSVAYPPKYGKGGPPWYVHLALHADGEYTLNRFFMMLLAQVNFYPYLSGVPPFEAMLEGAPKTVMTRAGYQYDLKGKLKPVPEHLQITEDHHPSVELGIDLTDKRGQRLAALQYMPWQDGAIIRAFGPEPLIKGVMPALGLSSDTLLIIDPATPNMWLTTITRITEAQFRKWPRMIQQRTDLRATLLSGEKQEPAEDTGKPSAPQTEQKG